MYGTLVTKHSNSILPTLSYLIRRRQSEVNHNVRCASPTVQAAPLLVHPSRGFELMVFATRSPRNEQISPQ